MRAVLEEVTLLIRPFDCGKILAWPESVCHSAVVGKARFPVLSPPCPAEGEGASVSPLYLWLALNSRPWTTEVGSP